MLKYKVTRKIICDKEDIDIDKYYRGHSRIVLRDLVEKQGFLGYKIIAGLYIFYISEEVYHKGVEEDIIEPIDENVKEFSLNDMLCSRGQTVYHRMGYALEHSTIDYLKSELERIENEPDELTLKIYRTKWWSDDKEMLDEPILNYLHEIKVDIKEQKIISNSAFGDNDIIDGTLFSRVDTYEKFLSTLAHYLDREYMNTRHIIDKFSETGFYDVDYWMQRLYYFEFSFNNEK